MATRPVYGGLQGLLGKLSEPNGLSSQQDHLPDRQSLVSVETRSPMLVSRKVGVWGFLCR